MQARPCRSESRWKIHTRRRPPTICRFRYPSPWKIRRSQAPPAPRLSRRKEILATKLRALLRRNKGHDLIDLAHARAVFKDIDAARVVMCFGQYLDASGDAVSRARAEDLAANDGQQFLRKLLPNTDCTFWIERENQVLHIRNAHHDAPTGEGLREPAYRRGRPLPTSAS